MGLRMLLLTLGSRARVCVCGCVCVCVCGGRGGSTGACIHAVCLYVVFNLIFMFLMFVVSSTGGEMCGTCQYMGQTRCARFVVGKLDVTFSETQTWMPGQYRVFF